MALRNIVKDVIKKLNLPPSGSIDEDYIWRIIHPLFATTGLSGATEEQIKYMDVAQGLYQSIVPQIAHDAYLKNAKASSMQDKQAAAADAFGQLSPFLKKHFKGVSIQDLIENDLVPPQSATEWDGEEELNLSNLYINDLTGLDKLPDAPNLQTLKLNDNRISLIAPSTFAGLANLKDLFLNRNEITTIDQGAFTGLAKLGSLFLDNNQIAAIAQGAFTGLTNLGMLYLNNNEILDTAQEGIRTEVQAVAPGVELINF